MEKIVVGILNKENIQFNKLTKSTSGFTNIVYFADDYVVKFSNNIDVKNALEKEISIYKNIQISNIPKLIASGDFEDYKYLIISKISGDSLYSIWHTLTEKEREKCVKKIAKILSEFNVQNYDFLNESFKIFNWAEHIKFELELRKSDLQEIGYNTDKLNNFIYQGLNCLFNENKFGLVYNDAHFDNFIYNNGELFLIDFDRVQVCPIDYEMMIFKTMCDNPSKFASEQDEDKIKNEDYENIYSIFKQSYPEMFNQANTEKRIRIYQFNYLMEQAIDIKNHNLIKQLLTEFSF